jgi:hypothetical protein
MVPNSSATLKGYLFPWAKIYEVTRWMLEWQIISEANERKDVKSSSISLSKQIIRHLVKIYKFKNPIDLNHHCNDLNTWIGYIESNDIKGGKKPTFKDYYEWMYENQKTSVSGIKSIVNNLKSYTANLKIIRSDDEVAILVQKVMYNICLDLARDNFEDVGDYIEKYPPYTTITDVGDDEDFEYNEELYHKMGW